jgi:hypothetical protein
MARYPGSANREKTRRQRAIGATLRVGGKAMPDLGQSVCLTCKGQGVVQTFGGTGIPTFPSKLVVCPECHGWKVKR